MAKGKHCEGIRSTQRHSYTPSVAGNILSLAVFHLACLSYCKFPKPASPKRNRYYSVRKVMRYSTNKELPLDTSLCLRTPAMMSVDIITIPSKSMLASCYLTSPRLKSELLLDTVRFVIKSNNKHFPASDVAEPGLKHHVVRPSLGEKRLFHCPFISAIN